MLEKVAAKLSEVYGERLLSLVAYGSAAGGHHHDRRSDINLLAVLDSLDAASLDQGSEVLRWWVGEGNAPIVLLTADEQQDAAAVFPIEYLDIHTNHRLLRGQDLFTAPGGDAVLHRRQVEHELRTKLLRLRGAYVNASRDSKSLEALLLDSISSFLTLFRHALVAVGEPLLRPKREVLAAAAHRFQFSATPFSVILDARQRGERLGGGKLDALRDIFAPYLAAIQTVERALEQAHVETRTS